MPRKASYAAQFAAAVIARIQAGPGEWKPAWVPARRLPPFNFATNQRFLPGNAMILRAHARLAGFHDPRWASARQIRAHGGALLPNQSPARLLVERALPPGVRVIGARPNYGFRWFYNVEQSTGLQLPPLGARPDWHAHQAADTVIAANSVTIRHIPGAPTPRYNRVTDVITLPGLKQFPSADAYYSSAFHELAHATAHPKRLNRPAFRALAADGNPTPEYAREELRAEMATMMTADKIGIGYLPQAGAAYIKHWADQVRTDSRAIFRAAVEGAHIAEYLVSPARQKLRQLERELHKPFAPHGSDRIHQARPPAPTLTRHRDLAPSR